MSEVAQPRPAAAKKTRSWASFRRTLMRNMPLLLMALPRLAVLFTFAYLPMPGVILAFKDYKAPQGIWGSAWVGLSNFKFLFGTTIAWRIIRNTVFLNLLFIVTNLVFAVGLAVLLNEIIDTFLARIYQAILFFPYFVSYVIVGYFVYIFLSSDSGAVNNLLGQLGLKPVNWFGQPGYWPIILVLVHLWHNSGIIVDLRSRRSARHPYM